MDMRVFWGIYESICCPLIFLVSMYILSSENLIFEIVICLIKLVISFEALATNLQLVIYLKKI